MIRKMCACGRQSRAEQQEGEEESSEEEVGSSSGTESSVDDGDGQEEDEEEEEDALEPWHEWVQRVTRFAEGAMKAAGVLDWVVAVRQQIWRLAGHIARREDGRWSRALLDWMPGEKRDVGRPLKRWEQDIESLFQTCADAKPRDWRIAATCREEWASYEQEFCGDEGEEEEEAR